MRGIITWACMLSCSAIQRMNSCPYHKKKKISAEAKNMGQYVGIRPHSAVLRLAKRPSRRSDFVGRNRLRWQGVCLRVHCSERPTRNVYALPAAGVFIWRPRQGGVHAAFVDDPFASAGAQCSRGHHRAGVARRRCRAS